MANVDAECGSADAGEEFVCVYAIVELLEKSKDEYRDG